MEFVLPIILLVLGIVIIVKGGDWFVDAASFAAEASGIPKLIVGATVVSLATTLPELLVSAFAAHSALVQNDPGLVEMAIGNSVGSVTANTGLILGIALVCMPAVIKRRDYALKMCLMLGAAGVLVVFAALYQGLTLLANILLVLIFCAAITENVLVAVRATKQASDGDAAARVAVDRRAIVLCAVKFVVGAACIVVGAELLKTNGSNLAKLCGVSERVIGVTVLAVGTSLPELVTTVTAILKKQASLSAGNILGANIIDLTLILPVCSLIFGGKLPAGPTVASIDLPAALIVGAVACVPTLITKKFARWQGILLIALYLGYVIVTVIG